MGAIVCSLTGAASAEQGEGFTGERFLEYPKNAQMAYITSSALMAGVIAAQNKKPQAQCIDKWAVAAMKNEYKEVIDAMSEFPDHHPTGVIVAVLQKACGRFKYLDQE
ncbi:hypothetical protein [Methyloligella halotolerans]|uniref:hypothetical protein n=1 Tax=Methyloligella halotolerans TaxID=1177755 RepID=UPI00114D3BB7|nr:hypothetical protein [Methyloligella halotolerans]